MKPCPIETDVLDQLELRQVSPLGSGMSGSAVFRCLHDTGRPMILKVWQPEMTEPRLTEITRLMVAANRELPSLVPIVFPLDRAEIRVLLRNSSQAMTPLPETKGVSSLAGNGGNDASESSAVMPLPAFAGDGVFFREGAMDLMTKDRFVPSTLVGSRLPRWGYCGSGFWQLIEQVAGESLPSDATHQQILDGVEAIRDLHQSFAWFGDRQEMPLAIRSRLARLDQVHRLLDGVISTESVTSLDSKLASAMIESVMIWNRYRVEMKRRIFSMLTVDSQSPMLTQYVLRDIHRENLFFHNGQVSGFFDFDAVRVDTPWADLSRWVGSFGNGAGVNDLLWQSAAIRFAEGHPTLANGDREWGCEFAKRLHQATTWISLGNWLVWLMLDQRKFAVPAEMLAQRLERICRSIKASN